MICYEILLLYIWSQECANEMMVLIKSIELSSKDSIISPWIWAFLRVTSSISRYKIYGSLENVLQILLFCDRFIP